MGSSQLLDKKVWAIGGAVTASVNECKDFKDEVSCAVKTGKAILNGITGGVSVQDAPLNAPVVQARKLAETKPITGTDACPFCVPEEEFARLYEGYVAGQAKLSDDVSEDMAIGSCLSDVDAYRAAYLGGLQTDLHELTFAV